MRSRPERIIFEIVMTHDQTRMLLANAHPCHPRVTIRIGEINVTGNEHILIIRAPGCQNERA